MWEFVKNFLRMRLVILDNDLAGGNVFPLFFFSLRPRMFKLCQACQGAVVVQLCQDYVTVPDGLV